MNTDRGLERLLQAARAAHVQMLDASAPGGFASRVVHRSFTARDLSWFDLGWLYRGAVACALAAMLISIAWSYPVVSVENEPDLEVASAVLQITMLP